MRAATRLLIVAALCGCTARQEPRSVHPHFERLYYPHAEQVRSLFKTFSDHHNAAVAMAEIGRHHEALEIFDRGLGYTGQPIPPFDGSNLLAVPAFEYVASEAYKHRITIINEEHHVSIHRFFTLQLLQKLYDAGYRYFGAETLSAHDSLLQERGYPTLETGYYTVEPQYGNLIREALRIGYKVFPYETTGGESGRAREIIQARKIAAVLASDSAAKILIHCGYAHLVESPMAEWEYAMAGWLREFTGIDPLTVDQVELTEHSSPDFENPYYRQMNYTDFVALIAGTGVMPLRFRGDGTPSDIFVCHPRTRLLHGRPHWLFSRYQPVYITDSVRLDFPVIVKAFLASEPANAVPADVIELVSSADSTALALDKGCRYRIEVSNSTQPNQIVHVDVGSKSQTRTSARRINGDH